MSSTPTSHAGRPTLYNPTLAASIVERLHERSLVQICEQDDDVPDRTTIQRWIARFPDFATEVARARSENAQFLIEKTTQLVMQCDEDNFRSTKVKMENAHWLAERLVSQVYGTKLQITGQIISLNMPASMASEYAQIIEGNAQKQLDEPKE